jgi:hypothetical protein
VSLADGITGKQRVADLLKPRQYFIDMNYLLLFQERTRGNSLMPLLAF